MTLQRDASGRLQIESPLMGESMMDKQLLASTDTVPIYRLMPDLNRRQNRRAEHHRSGPGRAAAHSG